MGKILTFQITHHQKGNTFQFPIWVRYKSGVKAYIERNIFSVSIPYMGKVPNLREEHGYWLNVSIPYMGKVPMKKSRMQSRNSFNSLYG